MDWREHKVTLGAVAAGLAVVWGVWEKAPDVIVLQAQAAEDKKAIARLIRADVSEKILDLELQKVRISNRTGLSDADKQEQQALIERKLEILRRREQCLEQGKVKCP